MTASGQTRQTSEPPYAFRFTGLSPIETDARAGTIRQLSANGARAIIAPVPADAVQQFHRGMVPPFDSASQDEELARWPVKPVLFPCDGSARLTAMLGR